MGKSKLLVIFIPSFVIAWLAIVDFKFIQFSQATPIPKYGPGVSILTGAILALVVASIMAGIFLIAHKLGLFTKFTNIQNGRYFSRPFKSAAVLIVAITLALILFSYLVYFSRVIFTRINFS